MRNRIRLIRLPARQITALLVAFQLVFAGLAAPEDKPRQPEKIGKGLNFFSEDQEVAMGRSYSDQLKGKLDLIDDSEVNNYVDRMGQRLADSSLRKDLDYHFFVVNTKEVNAFALPGGYIYVNRGLMDATENESELAGVLAHEIGHVVGKHSTKQLSKQLLLSGIAMGAGVAVGAKSKKWGEIVSLAGGIGVFFTTLKFSRNDEREADWLGMNELNEAGYDPWGMVTFFEKLETAQKGKGGGTPVFLSTHPLPAERRANMRKQVVELKPLVKEPARAGADYQRCRGLLAALPAPPPDRDKTLSKALAALDSQEGSEQGQPGAVEASRVASSAEIEIPGDRVWVDTGVDLMSGDVFEVSAKGEVFWKKNSEDSCGPDGIPGKGFWKPISKANTAALIGKIGVDSYSYFVVGSGFKGNALATGRLYLGINDDNNSDNRGGYKASIRVNR